MTEAEARASLVDAKQRGHAPSAPGAVAIQVTHVTQDPAFQKVMQQCDRQEWKVMSQTGNWFFLKLCRVVACESATTSGV
jgi:hypothetical protein